MADLKKWLTGDDLKKRLIDVFKPQFKTFLGNVQAATKKNPNGLGSGKKSEVLGLKIEDLWKLMNSKLTTIADSELSIMQKNSWNDLTKHHLEGYTVFRLW